MNIWDSVHRGLEKASHEAARIAKAQRLRSTLDNLTQQRTTQQGLVIARAMELYLSGSLPSGELFAACQELHNLHQHMSQVQSELNQVQSQQNTSGPGNPGNQRGQGTAAGVPDSQATQFISPESSFAPPPGYHPFDSAVPPLVPPPPPGVDANSGQGNAANESSGLIAPPPLVINNHCPSCHVALIPGNAFCHNCGTPVVCNENALQPTVRAGADSSIDSAETVGSEPAGMDEPPEVMDEY